MTHTFKQLIFYHLTLPPIPRRFWPIIVGIGLMALAWFIGSWPVTQVIVILGGLVGGALLMSYPVLTIYLLLVAIPYSGLLSVLEILVASSLGLTVLKAMVERRVQDFRVLLSAPLLLPFLLFLGSVTLSWLTPLSVRPSLIETIKWVEMLLIYLLVIYHVRVEQVRYLVYAMLLAGVSQALLGLYQFVFKVGPDGFLLFDGLFLRAYGTFGQPNPYAGYLGLILPLGVAVTFHRLRTLYQPEGFLEPFRSLGFIIWLKTALIGLSTLILLAALFATQSRGGWLAAIVALTITLALLSRAISFALGGVTLAVTIAALAGSFTVTVPAFNSEDGVYQTVLQRVIDATAIFTIEDMSAVEITSANFATLERLAHWQAAWHMWRDNLWLGVGFGNYEVVYPVYAIGRWEDPLGHAHNYLFNLGAETGLIGIIGYLIFWICSFAVIWPALRTPLSYNKALLIGGVGVLVHLHTHNLFDNLYVQGMYLHVAVILAMTSIIAQAKGECRASVSLE